MSTVQSIRKSGSRNPLTPVQMGGTVVGLWVLAVGQPVLDVLSRNPQFFLVRNSPANDVVLLVAAMTLLVPLLISALVVGLRRLNRIAGSITFLFTAGVLGALLFRQMLLQVGPKGASGALYAGLALVLSGAFTAAVLRNAFLRSVLWMGLILPVLVGGWVLFATPVSQILFPPKFDDVAGRSVSAPHDVFFLVFDEFPLATLLDGRGNLDAKTFPNFARFSKDATWYRNAITVSDWTDHAVPALLSGRYPDFRSRPTVVDHPHNIFTLLGSHFQMSATGLGALLCPESICPKERAPFGGRFRTLVSDAVVVTGHVILPDEVVRLLNLPPITHNWAFFNDQGGRENEVREFGEFVEGVQRHENPAFYFHHALLPHAPWRFLPDGRQYPQKGLMAGTVNGLGTKWTADDWLIAQGYQRHMLQSMAVDSLLGLFMDRLRDHGMYRDSLIVVVSDHGAAFEPDARRRASSPSTLGAIAPVPMFIKAPGQTTGEVVAHPVQTIDLLPTVAAILQVEPPWRVDGQSLFPTVRSTYERRLRAADANLAYSDEGHEIESAIRKKYDVFGASVVKGLYRLAPEGTRRLIGRPEPAGTDRAGTTATILDPESYEDVDLGQAHVPAYVQGSVSATESNGPPVIAVGLNGVIAAVTRGFDPADQAWQFTAILPPHLLREGPNDLRIYVVTEQDGSILFTEAEQF